MDKKTPLWHESYYIDDNGTVANWNFAIVPPLFKPLFKHAVSEHYDPVNNFWVMIGNDTYEKQKDVILYQAQLMAEFPFYVVEKNLKTLTSDSKFHRRQRVILQEVLMLPCLDLQRLNNMLEDLDTNLTITPALEEFTKLKQLSISAMRFKIYQYLTASYDPISDVSKKATALLFFLMTRNVCSQALLDLESINDRIEVERARKKKENDEIKAQNCLSDYLVTRYTFLKHAKMKYLGTSADAHLKTNDISTKKKPRKKPH